MSFIEDRVKMEGVTFDDVLLIPAYSEVLPNQVNLTTKFSRNITLNVPLISAAMDTVTESQMAIAIARERLAFAYHILRKKTSASPTPFSNQRNAVPITP